MSCIIRVYRLTKRIDCVLIFSIFLLSSSSSSYNQIIIEGGAQTLADMTTPPRTGRWEVFGETNPPGTGIGSHHIVICENITSLVDFNKISGW